MAVVKWTMSDGVTTMTFEYNPFTMDSPHEEKNIQVLTARNLTVGMPSPATQWTFEGNVYNNTEYNKLVSWHEKDEILELTDHLGRTWNVISENLAITDRRNSAKNSTRYSYKWTVLNLGLVTGG